MGKEGSRKDENVENKRTKEGHAFFFLIFLYPWPMTSVGCLGSLLDDHAR